MSALSAGIGTGGISGTKGISTEGGSTDTGGVSNIMVVSCTVGVSDLVPYGLGEVSGVAGTSIIGLTLTGS